jgi:DNA-binding PadR family transcriptional regulator
VIDITEHDTSFDGITEEQIMGDNKENIALTEAVYYILLSLWQPLHGYGIMQNVMDLSDGRVNLAAGTLYGALNTLLEKGLIQAVENDENSRRKEYVITQNGMKVMENELIRLKELIDNGETIIGGSKE